MKILTKEEEQAHYKYPAQSSQPTPPSNLLLNNNSETIKGGAIGGTTGLLIGVLGVYGAGIRYPAFRHLTLPLRAFLCTSGATFGGTRLLFYKPAWCGHH